MTEREALEILRAQGHAVSTPDPATGTVRIWVYGTDRSIDVTLGRELIHLAEGKLTFEVLAAERRPVAA